MMNGIGCSSALAMAPNGQRLPGVHHHIYEQRRVLQFQGHLDTITRVWHIECQTNNLSVGFMVEMTGVVSCDQTAYFSAGHYRLQYKRLH